MCFASDLSESRILIRTLTFRTSLGLTEDKSILRLTPFLHMNDNSTPPSKEKNTTTSMDGGVVEDEMREKATMIVHEFVSGLKPPNIVLNSIVGGLAGFVGTVWYMTRKTRVRVGTRCPFFPPTQLFLLHSSMLWLRVRTSSVTFFRCCWPANGCGGSILFNYRYCCLRLLESDAIRDRLFRCMPC